MLTPREAEALRKHLADPPPGSAVARAIAFGIDLSLTMRNAYGLTIEERLAKLEEHLAEATQREPLGRVGPLQQ